jgi:hypothetical protein
VGQPGTDQHQWRTGLRQLVTGRAQSRDVFRRQVLHLVDKDRHSGRDVGRQFGDIGEQLEQVDLHISGIGPAGGRQAVDRRRPAVHQLAAPRIGPQPEGLEHRQHLGHPIRGTVPHRQLAHRGVQRAGQRPAQAGVRPCLHFPRSPAAIHRLRAQRIQQHRTHSARRPGQRVRVGAAQRPERTGSGPGPRLGPYQRI